MMKTAFRTVTLGLLSLSFAGVPAHAETQKVCDQVVKSMQQEWQQIGYATPSKPTTMRVTGKLGHENTATQVAYMQEQMRLAAEDCRNGKQESALQRISSIHDILDQRGISPEIANAAMIPDEKASSDKPK